MTRHLVTPDGQVAPAELDHLRWLISRAAAVRAHHIVVPFVDSSSARDGQRAHGMAEAFRSLVSDAARAGVELHLETDLAPHDAVALLSGIGSDTVRATYDIGNSAALGFDPEQEVTTIGAWKRAARGS